ncbi:MAG: hypothetical protein ACOCP4_03375, partial [Candidatus Woesearchaeota archaeon]
KADSGKPRTLNLDCATVNIIKNQDNSISGNGFAFESDSNKMIKGSDINQILDGLKENFDNRKTVRSIPFYLIRYVDAENKVISFDMLPFAKKEDADTFEKIENRIRYTLNKGYNSLIKKYPDLTSINIVPGERHVISSDILKDKDSFKKYQNFRANSLADPNNNKSICLGRSVTIGAKPDGVYIHSLKNNEDMVNPVTLGGLEIAEKNNLPEYFNKKEEPVENDIPTKPYSDLGSSENVSMRA